MEGLGETWAKFLNEVWTFIENKLSILKIEFKMNLLKNKTNAR